MQIRGSASLRPLRRTGFRRLFVGQAVSSLGDWLGTFALMALVLEITGSSTAVGGILALRLTPALVAGPLIARAVSRWSPRRMMLGMDLLRMGVAALIPLVSSVAWVYGWALVIEASGLVFLAARDGVLGELVDGKDLPMANGLVLGSSYGSLPLGAACFTAISTLFDFHLGPLPGGRFLVAFWLDAATFGVSYLFVSRVAELQQRAATPVSTSGHGFGEALRLPLVRATLPPMAAASLGIGTLFSLGIVFVLEVLGADMSRFGILILFFALGAAAGLALRQFGTPPGGSVWAIRTGVGAMGVILAAMSLTRSLGPVYLAAAAFGAAGSYAIVSGITALQSELPETERILALGAFHVSIRVALGLGALGAGTAADLLAPVSLPLLGRLGGVRTVLFFAGLVVVTGAFLMRETPPPEGNAP